MADDNPAPQAAPEIVKNLDPQNLAREIARALQEADHTKLWVDREQHAEDHKFIRALVEREKRKEERAERIKERLIGTAIVSSIFTALGYVGKWAIEFVNHYIMNIAASGSSK